MYILCAVLTSLFQGITPVIVFTILPLKGKKVLKIGLHFSSNSFFLELMLSANKKENEKMHTIYFSKYLASQKSILKTCFPLSLYLHWYDNFEHEQR